MFDNLLWTLVWALVADQAAVLATSIKLYRGETHQSLVLHPIIDWLFRCVLWITTGIYRRNWVAVHRKHHTFTETEKDPHSPRQKGFWNIQIGNIYYYVKATKEQDLLTKYAPNIKDDVWDRWFFNHGLLGLAIGITSLCVLLGWRRGLLAARIHAFLYVFVISSSINGLCHWFGYKNFDNTAGNIPILAWLTGGEAWHNNHHNRQRCPQFSYRHDEFDPSWSLVIRPLEFICLAEPYRGIGGLR